MYFEVYRTGGLLSGDWRWRLKAANHHILADSAEGYRNKDDCLYALNLVKSTNYMTPVIFK